MAWKKTLTYNDALTTELDSLASGSIAYSNTVFDNTSVLDEVLFLSMNLASVAPSAANPSLAIYILPLNDDNTTYGDQPSTVPGTQSTIIPSFNYYFGPITLSSNTTAALQTGTSEFQKSLPPSKYIIGINNLLGSALGTGNTIKYATNTYV